MYTLIFYLLYFDSIMHVTVLILLFTFIDKSRLRYSRLTYTTLLTTLTQHSYSLNNTSMSFTSSSRVTVYRSSPSSFSSQPIAKQKSYPAARVRHIGVYIINLNLITILMSRNSRDEPITTRLISLVN